MACRNNEASLNSLIGLAIQLDNLLWDRKPKKITMQLKNTLLTSAEREMMTQMAMLLLSRCQSCHYPMNWMTELLFSTYHHRDSSLTLPLLCLSIFVYHHHSNSRIVLSATIDSGLAGNFIKHTTTTKLQISLCTLNNPPRISSIDGGPFGVGTEVHVQFLKNIKIFTTCSAETSGWHHGLWGSTETELCQKTRK